MNAVGGVLAFGALQHRLERLATFRVVAQPLPDNQPGDHRQRVALVRCGLSLRHCRSGREDDATIERASVTPAHRLSSIWDIGVPSAGWSGSETHQVICSILKFQTVRVVKRTPCFPEFRK